VGIGMFRARLNPAGLRWVNRISGTIIMGFGLLAFVSLI
jgi:threonine/homoserine/homoserine lactone efflux protein